MSKEEKQSSDQEEKNEEVEQSEDNIIQKLASEVKRLKEENTNLSNDIIRAKADNENLRKRHGREMEDTRKYVVGKFSEDLIDVMESLYKAIDCKKDFDANDTKVTAMFDGMDMTLKLLDKAFDKNGIKRIYPLDEEFNHELHQAVSQTSLKDKKKNQVIEVIQAGYTIQDRLLKPALVIVNQ